MLIAIAFSCLWFLKISLNWKLFRSFPIWRVYLCQGKNSIHTRFALKWKLPPPAPFPLPPHSNHPGLQLCHNDEHAVITVKSIKQFFPPGHEYQNIKVSRISAMVSPPQLSGPVVLWTVGHTHMDVSQNMNWSFGWVLHTCQISPRQYSHISKWCPSEILWTYIQVLEKKF